jgi:hypothetical protein
MEHAEFDDLNARTREIVEKNTRRPAYLATEEEWFEANAQALRELGVELPKPCPHCGGERPLDPRFEEEWVKFHLESREHRWAQKIMRKFNL